MCHKQVTALNQDLIAVHLRLRYVEKYKEYHAFQHIGEGDKSELIQYIAPLVQMDEKDEFAKRFDNFTLPAPWATPPAAGSRRSAMSVCRSSSTS